MKVEMLSAAEAELLDAVSFYNGQSEGLGYELALEMGDDRSPCGREDKAHRFAAPYR